PRKGGGGSVVIIAPNQRHTHVEVLFDELIEEISGIQIRAPAGLGMQVHVTTDPAQVGCHSARTPGPTSAAGTRSPRTRRSRTSEICPGAASNVCGSSGGGHRAP